MTEARDGILEDLARVGAMWLGDVRDLWCGGDKVRCTRVVQDLAGDGLVEVRRGCSDARRRYVVLTKKGIEVMGLGDSRRGSRMNVAAGERLAEQSALFVELVRSGVRREDILVSQELRARARLPYQSRPVLGLLQNSRLVVLIRAPISWKRWRRLLRYASGVHDWVILARDNRTWSRQLDTWVHGKCGTPTWIPKPSWSVPKLVEWLGSRDAGAWQAVREASRYGLDLAPAPQRRARRYRTEDQQFWCHVGGQFCLLEDFRAFPVHRLCVLATPEGRAQECGADCGVLAVVETARDASRLAKYLEPDAPWFFLVVGAHGIKLLRLRGKDLVQAGGGASA